MTTLAKADPRSRDGFPPGPPLEEPRRHLRVLLFHWNGDLYGASRSLLRLTSRLAAEGHRPVVVLGTRGPLAPALEAAGVRVRHSRCMPAVERSNLRSLFGLASLVVRALISIPAYAFVIARERPDLVHTNASVILTSGVAARMMGRPHVWHIRETFLDHSALWRVYRQVVAALSDRIICISECVAGQFPESVRRQKVAVVHNGIPREEMTDPDPQRAAALKTRWQLNGKRTVGVIGRINLPRKGQDVLVRAAAHLGDTFPNVRFLIVGTPYPGKEEEELRLRSLIREAGLEGRFVLTGEIEELPLIYALLDIVVVPSPVPEPFGNTAPEAMAYGIPVVGSNRGGTAEIVRHGETGLLFPPGDARSLAACLEVLLGDSRVRDELGEAGRRAFLERFEFEGCYRRLDRVFSRVASTAPAERSA